MEVHDERHEECQENEVRSEEAVKENKPFCDTFSILKAVEENSVVIVYGKTGIANSTMVCQMMYRRGYTRNNKIVGVTEPQRISTMAKAFKLVKQMKLMFSEFIAYEVKGDSTVDEDTEIKFMTDHILLREIKADPYLTKYSVIIVDEAQERSFFSDVVIGYLSQIVQHRKKKNDPLKVIIMCDTMHVQIFTENPLLFKEEPPFLLQADDQQYEIKVQYKPYPTLDVVTAAYTEVCEIHALCPPGAIFVFLASQEEVKKLCAMLQNWKQQTLSPESDSSNSLSIDSRNNRRRMKRKQRPNDTLHVSPNKKATDDCPLIASDGIENMSSQLYDNPEKICSSVQHYIEVSVSDEEDLMSDDEISCDEMLKLCEDFRENVVVYNSKEKDYLRETLYVLQLLPDHSFEQQEEAPPPDTRLCVVTTHVAESFISFADMRYVIDSGRVLLRAPNSPEGIPEVRMEWISKASANRRADFAGGMEGGLCIRLYPSSVFDQLPDHPIPEIRRLEVDEIILQLKAYGIVDVINFPFPSPPDRESLKASEKKLLWLGCLEVQNSETKNQEMNTEYHTAITAIGNTVLLLTPNARYAKMLMLSHVYQCVFPVSAIVAAMIVPRLFATAPPVKKCKPTIYDNLMKTVLWKGIKIIGARSGKSLELGDAMMLLRVVALFEESKDKDRFCTKIGVNYKAMTQIRRTRHLLHYEMKCTYRNISLPSELNIEPPDEKQIEVFQKVLAAGFVDHVARLFSEEEVELNGELKNAYQCLDMEDPVFIHPSSVLFSVCPKYVVYQEIVHSAKYYMKGVIAIKPEWLPELAPIMCEHSVPAEILPQGYDRELDKIVYISDVKFGPWKWELSAIRLEVPESITKYKWFIYSLLDGHIYDFFKDYRNHLFVSLSSIVESTDRSLLTTSLIESVQRDKISSKWLLSQKWRRNPKYLLHNYLDLLPDEMHLEVDSRWPPES